MDNNFNGRALLKTCLAVLLSFFLFASVCNASGVLLKWDASPEPGVKGYKLYFKNGSSGSPYDGEKSFQGSSPVTVPIKDLHDPDNPEYILFRLNSNETHFITATAYTDEEESSYSEFVVVTPYDEYKHAFDPIRINAGGDYYIDQRGRVWSKDYGYIKGKTAKTKHAINNMLDGALFKTERVGKNQLSYRFDVPPGKYLVNCYFSEIKKKYSRVGKRVFDVMIEDEFVYRDLDIFNEVGRDAALVKSFKVMVADEQLDIDFLPFAGKPKVSAIEIYKIN